MQVHTKAVGAVYKHARKFSLQRAGLQTDGAVDILRLISTSQTQAKVAHKVTAPPPPFFV
jgi:hypothetical protein